MKVSTSSAERKPNDQQEEKSMNKPQKDRSSGMTFPFQDAFKYFMIDPQTNWQRFYNPQFFINYMDLLKERDHGRMLLRGDRLFSAWHHLSSL